MIIDTHSIEFNGPIERWDEAIPLGNGRLGCLIWGDGCPVRFSLDRCDLWDKRTAPEWQDPRSRYQELIRLVNNKDTQTISELFDQPYSHPTPTKIPAGRIELDYGRAATKMNGCLQLSDALASLHLMFDETSSKIQSFLAAEKPCGFISIQGELPQVNLIPNHFYSEDDALGDHSDTFTRSHHLLGYPPPTLFDDQNIKGFRQKTLDDFEFAVILALKKIDSHHMEVAWTVASTDDGVNWFEDAKVLLQHLLERRWESAYQQHLNWWHEFWAKSSISIPDKDIERHWYLANYFLACCSRKSALPMPLQGVWTADEGLLPPWKGDYHNDLNVQMSYWHALKANHCEEHECLTDFLWSRVPKAREFANRFYDAPGLCFPSVMTPEADPLGGWPMYSLSMTNSIWLCQSFDHYWLYTGDLDFLKERAYPFFKESAECVLRWLSVNKDGKRVLPLSSSPEIHDDRLEAWLTPNSTYDLSLLRYLFSRLHQMAQTLDNGESCRWQEILSQLPEFSINQTGLMLSPDESLEESHRHLSHMLAVYPLDLIDAAQSESNHQLIDQTIQHMEELGTQHWVGYTFPWMACQHARLSNGNRAVEHLKTFIECFCSPNGFHLNGDYKNRGVSVFHYRPFTLEGNFCMAAALQEMLLQSINGVLRVFPAIPDTWHHGRICFENLRAEGGVLVSAEMTNGSLDLIRLQSKSDHKITIQNRFNSEELLIETTSDYIQQRCSMGDLFNLNLMAGHIYSIRVFS